RGAPTARPVARGRTRTSATCPMAPRPITPPTDAASHAATRLHAAGDDRGAGDPRPGHRAGRANGVARHRQLASAGGDGCAAGPDPWPARRRACRRRADRGQRGVTALRCAAAADRGRLDPARGRALAGRRQRRVRRRQGGGGGFLRRALGAGRGAVLRRVGAAMSRALPRTRGRMAGFTLLEAIVALVVFSMGAMALYGWLSTNVITLNRIGERQQVEEAMLSALDMIRGTNAMEMPNGQRQAGDLRVVWNSVPVVPARPNAHRDGMPGIFQVGLYDAEVRVLRDSRQLHVFKVR